MLRLFCVTRVLKIILLLEIKKRDNLFARHHIRYKPLYHSIEEIDERISNSGKVIKKIDYNKLEKLLKKLQIRDKSFINNFDK